MMQPKRLETQRVIEAPAADLFTLLCDPRGHVAIDASGMLQDSEGDPVRAAGDSFVVHMDREPLGDLPMGRYDVTVTIRDFEPDQLISWEILGTVRPAIGHYFGYRLEAQSSTRTEVTSFYDWAEIREDFAAADMFPVVPESALRATLGILDRTVRHGYS